jgi:carbon monoxide dehydrogenase subunit G
MELEHSFTVPVPEERAWEVLLDVNRVAPCMPGATLDSVDGNEIKGRIKVKVGPIAMTYAGTARFTERDPDAHVITLEASGKETRGAGTASATVRSVLEGEDNQTHVVVHTTLNVTGRPAQFGRGVMAEVGGKLIGIFASNLADMLAAEPAQSADEATAGEPAAGAAAAGAAAAGAAAAGAAAAGEATGGEPAGDEQAGGEDQSVESLDLSLRSYNSLRREGIHTVSDLAARTREELLAIENIGPASVEEIRQRLAGRGLTLSDSPASANGVAGSAAGRRATGVSPAPAAGGSGAAAGSGTGSTTPVTPAVSRNAPAGGGRSSDDDAINLLSVAGAPVLKRAIPVVAAVAAAAVIVLRIRGKRRRSSRG